MRTKTIGNYYVFRYPNYGTPDSLPEYTAHRGQRVRIVRQLTHQECDPECQPMWLIKAKDGWEGNAHSSELWAEKSTAKVTGHNRKRGTA